MWCEWWTRLWLRMPGRAEHWGDLCAQLLQDLLLWSTGRWAISNIIRYDLNLNWLKPELHLWYFLAEVYRRCQQAEGECSFFHFHFGQLWVGNCCRGTASPVYTNTVCVCVCAVPSTCRTLLWIAVSWGTHGRAFALICKPVRTTQRLWPYPTFISAWQFLFSAYNCLWWR